MDNLDEIARGLSRQGYQSLIAMSDDEMRWSATHDWPTVCDELSCAGLVKITSRKPWQGHQVEYTSIMSPLGLALRNHLLSAAAVEGEG